jgi:hypothetical protein
LIHAGSREFEAENRKKEMESIREPVPLRERKPKPAEHDSDAMRRQRDPSAELRPALDSSKKGKSSYNFKAEAPHADTHARRAELVLNKFKALNN